jgi:branched-chain amino acid transport system ATP-binding protein
MTPVAQPPTIASLSNVTKRFGGLVAVRDVSFELTTGEIVGLIGPNGAGKTTLVNLMAHTIEPDEGSIMFLGRKLDRMSPHRIARLGLARAFQIVQPFPKMTALENVMAGSLFAGGSTSIAAARSHSLECLEFCNLADVADSPASSLTLPTRKRLEVAKALATRPKLLLLDEVNAGLNASEIDSALVLIKAVAARGITILIIEHLMKVVLQACARVLVLHQGALIADGTPHEIVHDAQVAEAYLGTRFAKRTTPPTGRRL